MSASLPTPKTLNPEPIDISLVPAPCFVLEERLLRRNLEILDRVQKATGAHIICALKGFSMFSTFPLVSQYLKGCTASSLYEARLAYEEFAHRDAKGNIQKGDVHAYAPAYYEDEIEEMMQYCSHLTFNSLSQWERFKPHLERYEKMKGKRVSAGLRINPQYSEVEVDLYNPCLPGTRFGITADKLETLPEGIEGLHFHTLCEQGAETLARTLEQVEKKFGQLLHQVKWLNMGGGHHITRQGYNINLLIELLNRIQKTYNVQVILEPGEAVGWQTGYLVASVQDIIDSEGIKVAILDISFTAHLPDCLEMPYKPKVWGASEPTPDSKYVYRFGGSTCLSGDYIGMNDFAFESPLNVGDKIVFDDMIHYTMVKTTTFNGVRHPSIAIWTEENQFRLVRHIGYEMFKYKLS
jgi:carboxynorspermidine decarboxylase